MSKKQSEQETVTPEPPSQSAHIGKKRLFVTTLSILFVVSGILILQIHQPNPTRKSATPSIPTPVVTETPKNSVTPLISLPEPEVTTPVVETAVEPKEMMVEEPIPTEEPASVEEPVLPEALALHSKLAAGSAKLVDLLALRDNFANNETCQKEYQKLLALEPRTPLLQEAVDALQPFCTKSEPVLHALTQTFSKAKKRALMAYYKAKYPKWWFIKFIPVSVIEIRRINPTKNRPIDNLYRAHNALLRQDIEQSIRFVDALPPLMRTQMDDFVLAAGAFDRALKSLDSAVLSFEKGE